MSLKYCCFISYRRRTGEKELAERLADKLREQLALLMAGSTGVFRDDDYVKVGDLLDEELAQALCESVCMLIIYTPTTFEPGHPYCAREYAAMKALEQTRLARLAAVKRPRRGPILALPFRGEKTLPRELADRDPYPFNGVRADLQSSSVFATVIPQIAEDITAWCSVLDQHRVPAHGSAPCEQFRLPAVDDATVHALLQHTAQVFPPNPVRR